MIWKSVGVSVIGSSHIKIGKPCQDSHGIKSLSDDVLLLAVADGLGSAEHSDIGSRLAVDTVLHSLTENLPVDALSAEACQVALERAFASARQSLENRALEENLDIRDLGTTLICTILAPNLVASAQIGDGAVIMQHIDGQISLLSSPQRGEYANETVPLTTSHAMDKVRYATQSMEIQCLAAISDGLQNLALKGTEYVPFDQFFTPFFNLLENSNDLEAAQKKIVEFLSSERVLGRTDDDKTLLIVVREKLEEIETIPINFGE